MSVISKKSSFLGTTTAALLVFLVTILSQAQRHSVNGIIIITMKEEQCLEKTGLMIEAADDDLLKAMNDFSESKDMNMTSAQKMYLKYPATELKNYESYCEKYGMKMHIITIDFFDCILRGSPTDTELTLKNYGNCMADVEECEGFRQEHLFTEAWSDMGLNCILEEEETKKDPPNGKGNNNVDDDIAKKEKEATAEGADDVDREEKNSEYVPKEEQGKGGKNTKKKGRFMKFVLFLSVCGAGYFVFDRKRRGLPIELPHALSSRLPFGGASTSRFDRIPRNESGFASNYNLISPEENTLQFTSNLA